MGTTYHLSEEVLKAMGDENESYYFSEDPSYHIGKKSGGYGFSWAMPPDRYAKAVWAYFTRMGGKGPFAHGYQDYTFEEFNAMLEGVTHHYNNIGVHFC